MSAALSRRRAVLAVVGLFVGNGLMVGGFGGSLPGLRAHLDLTGADVVTVLVTAGVLAVLAMQVAGRLVDRVGARWPGFLGGVLSALSLGVIAGAPDRAWLLVGAGLFGLGNGFMDVSMNALGVVVEEARGGPIMSRFHAFFSVGNLLGAALVAVLGELHVRVPLVSGAALVLALLLGTLPLTPQTPPVAAAAAGEPRGIPPLAWLLAVMAICFGLTEGAAVDWSALHTTDVARVSPNEGAWGLAAVSGLMVLIRLVGDHAVARWGRRSVVAGGAVFAVLGYVAVGLVSTLPLVLLGWALVGFGVGLIAPQIYGLAGRAGGARTLALVVSFGYAAFLTGPALIGLVAAHAGIGDRPGIQDAMVVPLVTAIGLVVMAARLPGDAMSRREAPGRPTQPATGPDSTQHRA